MNTKEFDTYITGLEQRVQVVRDGLRAIGECVILMTDPGYPQCGGCTAPTLPRGTGAHVPTVEQRRGECDSICSRYAQMNWREEQESWARSALGWLEKAQKVLDNKGLST